MGRLDECDMDTTVDLPEVDFSNRIQRHHKRPCVIVFICIQLSDRDKRSHISFRLVDIRGKLELHAIMAL